MNCVLSVWHVIFCLFFNQSSNIAFATALYGQLDASEKTRETSRDYHSHQNEKPNKKRMKKLDENKHKMRCWQTTRLS